MSNTWFSKLFGFRESKGYSFVKNKIVLADGKLTCTENNRVFEAGDFSTPSVKELREKVKLIEPHDGKKLRIKMVAVQDIYKTHQETEYKGALFQVASQFNCLEFISPGVVPEVGITGYISDHTQGPSCSLACPAATLFRNYYAPTPKGNFGQSKFDQINNLDGIERLVDNETNNFWKTKNGYTDSTQTSLTNFNTLLQNSTWNRDDLISELKIGVHSNVEVISTKEDQKIIQKVNQAFCSAISIGYSSASSEKWENVARIVLDGTYEATLLSSVIQHANGTGSNVVVLTFIGGGVFRNDMNWIADSIGRACAILSNYDIIVEVAFYRRIDTHVACQIENCYNKYVQLYSEKPELNPLRV